MGRGTQGSGTWGRGGGGHGGEGHGWGRGIWDWRGEYDMRVEKGRGR